MLWRKFRDWLQWQIRHSVGVYHKWSGQNQLAQQALKAQWKTSKDAGTILPLGEVGFRNFSQFEEDGILLYIFTIIGVTNKTFVDLGSSDGINSNCANLAVHHGWTGLFVDGDEQQIMRGKTQYAKHPSTMLHPPAFVCEMITRENIDELIKDARITGEIDLLSIDIDGHDFWVWDAIDCIQPRVVIIETHVEFGMNNIVVPYDKDYVYPGRHPQYHGASPVAMEKLAKKKGYRLVGSNSYGFNTIYIQNGVGEDVLPEVTVESILQHPRNNERFKLFDEIKDWKYETV